MLVVKFNERSEQTAYVLAASLSIKFGARCDSGRRIEFLIVCPRTDSLLGDGKFALDQRRSYDKS